MNDYLHIVCLDAPSPPDYGGAMDMYYKIKALHGIGTKIILHYFEYRSARNADSLKEYCTAIYSYQRKSFWQSRPLSHPFIVESRINPELVQRLNEDEHPVLLEGLHCSGVIPFLKNRNRVVIRMHNEEATYYRHLAKTERSLSKRSYFFRESRLLKRYQQTMNKDFPLACLSESDSDVLREEYGFHRSVFIPCFLPWQETNNLEGTGNFCLYQGNLSVPENEEAARWLIENVFKKINVPLVVAGRGISKTLKKSGKGHPNLSFINNPSIAEIDRLVHEAHINVLPSLNDTGVKLKLLNALLNGRHCITNTRGIRGSRIESGLLVKESAADWVSAINLLMPVAFSAADREARKAVLQLYNNKENAEKLSALWSHYR